MKDLLQNCCYKVEFRCLFEMFLLTMHLEWNFQKYEYFESSKTIHTKISNR